MKDRSLIAAAGVVDRHDRVLPQLWQGRCSILFFLASLALPALGPGEAMWGFQAALLSFVGVGLVGDKPALGAACLAGAAANTTFLLAYATFLWRSLVRFRFPGFRTVSWLALASAACGAASGAILLLTVRYESYSGLVGFFVWTAAPVALAAAARRVPAASTARGFEVGTAAAVASHAVAVPARPPAEADTPARRRAGRTLLLGPVVTAVVAVCVVGLGGRGEWWALPILVVWVAGSAARLARASGLWLRNGGRREGVLWAALVTFTLGAALPLVLWYPMAAMVADAASRRDWGRLKFYFAVGRHPDAAVVSTPYAFYLGSPGVRTALYEALTHDDLETADLLLARGADPNKPCGPPNENRLPLAHALQRQNPAMVALLRRHGGRLDADAGPQTQALEFQLRAGGGVPVAPEVVDGLFREAVLASNMESIAYLHGRGARVAGRGAHAQTPLHLALRAGPYGGGRGIPKDELVRWLVEAGADVNARNDAGETPLSLAVDQSWRGPASHALVRLLLGRGANAAVGNRAGKTPLHRAVAHGLSDVAATLLDAGAEVGARDSKGRTPLHGASSVPLAGLLLRRGADPNARDGEGSTPLHAAASTSVEVVTLLVEHGSDVNARSKGLSTPLLAAASWEKPDVLTYLLDRGADVLARDRNGWTPLYYAARRGNVGCIRLLLERGADVAARANDGSTPSGVARRYNHAAAVDVLEKWHHEKGVVPPPK